MRYPLVDGQGNFGSVDGDNAAAMRYTEMRLTRFAAEMIGDDIDKETVDWVPNYDGSLRSRWSCRAKFPNLLVNGSTAASRSAWRRTSRRTTSAEVIDATIELIRHPDATLGQLMKNLPGPDFPTAGFIHGAEGIRDAYKTGRGIVQVRARAMIEKAARGDKESIVVTEIPYQVNKAKLIERIAELVNEKKIDGHRGPARRVRPRRHADRRGVEARRERPGHPEQALRADADAVDVRDHLPGDRRQPAARPARSTTCCGTSSTTASRWSSAARSST